MRRAPHRSFARIAVFVVCFAACLGGGGSRAAESDLSTTASGPAEARLGEIIPITVVYANAGPNVAESAYVNVFIPSGVPARLDDLTQAHRDAIQASAEGTDTLGNQALLFDEENFCEGVYLQLQRDDDDDHDDPVEGLVPGVSASFGFELEIPMEPPRFGRLTITEPTSLAQMWRPALTERDLLEAGSRHLYSQGACEKLVGSDEESACAHIFDNCLGERVSLMDPAEAEFELVDDGSSNPSWGCGPLDSFTPGNIALMRRGGCEFASMGFNAQQAGAIAVVIVNDDGCGNHPDSAQCVIEMYPGLGGFVTVPVVMLARADGEPIIAAIEADTTVRGIIGPQEGELVLDSVTFLADVNDLDPNPDNDQDRAEIEVIPEDLTPPVASFTYSPANPTVGDVIQFTDTSTLGPPTAWAWDFGDGIGTSTDQNPAYSYPLGGTYTISLTVSNSAGFDTSEQTLLYCCDELSFRYVIPAAAFAAGAEGSFFQTDLDVNNAGPTTALFVFEWLPRGSDNRSPLVSDTFTLGAGMSARYTNIVAEIFGLEPNAIGAISIVSNSLDLIGLSRTYNLEADAGGTFGQALPAIPTQDMIPTGERRRIVFMTENDDYRSNLGCLNATSENLRIMIELFDDQGSSLEILHLDLPPQSNKQLNRVFADYAPVMGAIDVWTTKANGSFTCYGSLLDNGTNDPTTVMPQ